jgi:alpha-beta hydrolase superfamily lysophospholipase
MSSAPPVLAALPPESLYLTGTSDPVFVTLHRSPLEVARDTAVILAPPFGWDEVCSYRSLRAWAGLLAQAGYSTARLSLPSTGDSGGRARDPDRVGAWTGSIDAAARWIVAETGAGRVATVGIGLSAILAVLATAGGASVDQLVLWGAHPRGRALVRQLRAFSKLETSRFFEGLDPPPPLPDGELEAGGFLLSADTVRQLEAIDLTAVGLSAARPLRALLLERDGITVDQQLREHFESAGTEVTVAPGPGYGAMTSHPQQARPPLEVISRLTAWLDHSAQPARVAAPLAAPAPGAVSSAEIGLRGVAAVRETPVSIPQPFGSLSGVLVEPLQRPRHQLRMVLLNAGAVRRIGPSRMWVELARRWAARGLPTLRLDVEGIGDADGDETPYTDDGGLYVPALVPQVQSAIDFLQARVDGERFVLAGLCAGAYWAFHAGLRDPRVCAALMVNPRALIWDTGLGPARDLRALLTEPFSLAKLRRVATGPRLRSFLHWLAAGPARSVRRLRTGEASTAWTERDLDAALEQFCRSGRRGLMLFSDHEPLHDELVRSGRLAKLAAWSNMTFEHVSVRDHTMRPNWAQQQAQAIVDQAIQNELAVELAQVDSGTVPPSWLESEPPLTT